MKKANKYHMKKPFHNHPDNNNQNDNYEFIFESSNNDKDKPEWMKPETAEIKDNKMRFHEEILNYFNYISPNKETLIKCQETIDLLTKIIKKNKPKWELFLFGSYGQTMPTVFSDIDIVISCDYNKDFELKEMYNLMNILKAEGFCDKIRLVKARVSIIKATCIATGKDVEISMNNLNGCHAVKVIRKILKKYKILKPAIIILKILLKKFNLNESNSGGMSSYILFHLIYFVFIHKFKKLNVEEKNEYIPSNNLKLDEKNEENNSNKELNIINEEKIIKDENNNDTNNLIDNYYREEENNNNYEMNLGEFILLFLKFYGYKFDYKNNGISLNDDSFGKIFIKNERPDIKYNNNLCVESIIEKGSDVGKSCYNYEKIVQFFKGVYEKINTEIERNNLSILQSLGFPTI